MNNRYDVPTPTIESLEDGIRVLEEVLHEGDQAPPDKRPDVRLRSARIQSLSIKRGQLALLLSGQQVGYALHPDQGTLF